MRWTEHHQFFIEAKTFDSFSPIGSSKWNIDNFSKICSNMSAYHHFPRICVIYSQCLEIYQLLKQMNLSDEKKKRQGYVWTEGQNRRNGYENRGERRGSVKAKHQQWGAGCRRFINISVCVYMCVGWGLEMWSDLIAHRWWVRLTGNSLLFSFPLSILRNSVTDTSADRPGSSLKQDCKHVQHTH